MGVIDCYYSSSLHSSAISVASARVPRFVGTDATTTQIIITSTTDVGKSMGKFSPLIMNMLLHIKVRIDAVHFLGLGVVGGVGRSKQANQNLRPVILCLYNFCVQQLRYDTKGKWKLHKCCNI